MPAGEFLDALGQLAAPPQTTTRSWRCIDAETTNAGLREIANVRHRDVLADQRDGAKLFQMRLTASTMKRFSGRTRPVCAITPRSKPVAWSIARSSSSEPVTCTRRLARPRDIGRAGPNTWQWRVEWELRRQLQLRRAHYEKRSGARGRVRCCRHLESTEFDFLSVELSSNCARTSLRLIGRRWLLPDDSSSGRGRGLRPRHITVPTHASAPPCPLRGEKQESEEARSRDRAFE